jgi:hypothetical protein
MSVIDGIIDHPLQAISMLSPVVLVMLIASNVLLSKFELFPQKQAPDEGD